MVFRQGGLLFKWNSANVVFAGVIYGLCNLRQCGFSPLTVVRVVCCPNIFLELFSAVWTVYRQCGLSLGWSFV